MMKKITLLLLLLTVSFGYSQIVESFDPAPAEGVWVSNPAEPMTTVDVIDATVDFATYGKVGRMISDAAGLPWQNAVLSMTAFSIDVTTTKTITANVYYNGGSPINILGKLTEGVGQPNKEIGVDHPGTGWSLLTWDFTASGATGEYNKISFFINRAAGGAWEGNDGSTVSREVWIDNITAAQGSAIVSDPVPATGPTDPVARATSDYMSFYNGIASPTGDEYVNETGVNFDSFGGSTIEGDVVLGDGNTVVKYKNHLYSGIGSGSYDVSGMEKLHIDVWSPGFTSFKVKLEANNGSNVEIEVPDAKVQNTWNSYDIDLSGYSAVDLANLKWITIVSYTPPGELLYVDNVYFWKTPVDPNTDATLQDLTVSGTTVTDFDAGTLTYDIELAEGTTVVPTVVGIPTQASPATAATTDATELPGTSTVLVTAQDGSTEQTYTLNFTVAIPGISNYCNTEVLHLNIPAETASAINLTIVNTGANTMKVTAAHADIDLLDLAGAITDNPTVSDPDTSVGGEISRTLTWTTAPAGDVSFQFIVWSKTTSGGNWQIENATTPFDGTCATAGIEDLEKFNFAIYPNPANDVINLRAGSEIEFVEVYDITGRRVLKNTPNAKSKTLNVSGLSKGIYMVKVGIEGSVGTTKLLKQ